MLTPRRPPRHGTRMKPDHPTNEAYAAAGAKLGCEERAIRAVAIVEAGVQGAFLDSDEPVILFERHKFDRLSGGKYRGATVPGTTTEPWRLIAWPNPGGYGPYSVQHRRLQAAAALDRDAALKSASWGLYQILAVNHEAAGHQTLQGFITAMYRGVDEHL